ncbi:MAG TPA: hypothetical protein VFV48_07565, partial [Pseudomonadales bacterium]|nr:hypothetical protein [Pseudomonadales bacterium]
MKNRFSKNYLISASAGLLAGLLLQPVAAAPLSLSNIPLIVAITSDPNMMFLFDTSGSMNHIVVDKPYDASTIYGTCPETYKDRGTTKPLALNNSTTYYLVNSSGTAKIGNASGTPSWTDNTAGKCFNPSLTYQASLIAPSDSSLADSLRYYSYSYSGNYLNWYFSNSNQSGPNTSLSTINLTSSITGVRRSDAKTRMEVAKSSLSILISNSLTHTYVGLTTFDSSSVGASVVVDLDKIDTGTHKTNLLNKINTLGAYGGTPLTSTLAQVGRYFVKSGGAYYGSSPNVSKKTNIHDLFTIEPKEGAASKDYITSACQKSFIVTMTDGEPSSDTKYNTELGKWADNQTSEDNDFDDVAAAMFDIDFKYSGDGTKPDDFKNNIVNYTIGFELNTTLLENAAKLGGGKYFTVSSGTDLSKAFEDATTDIVAKSGTMSSVAFNSSQLLDIGSAIYQAKFNSGNWYGALEAKPLDKYGVIGSVSWEAGALLNSMTYTNRKIFTYDKTTLKDGIPFAWANMNTAQKDDLRVGVDSNNSGSVDDT